MLPENAAAREMPRAKRTSGYEYVNRNADRILKNAITGVSEQRSGQSHHSRQTVKVDPKDFPQGGSLAENQISIFIS
jgi:hypothetical protein